MVSAGGDVWGNCAGGGVLIFLAVSYLLATYVVMIENHATAPLRDARVVVGAIHTDAGTTPPGERRVVRLRPRTDGTMMFEARLRDATVESVVFGYESWDMGGPAHVRVEDDATARVRTYD